MECCCLRLQRLKLQLQPRSSSIWILNEIPQLLKPSLKKAVSRLMTHVCIYSTYPINSVIEPRVFKFLRTVGLTLFLGDHPFTVKPPLSQRARSFCLWSWACEPVPPSPPEPEQVAPPESCQEPPLGEVQRSASYGSSSWGLEIASGAATPRRVERQHRSVIVETIGSCRHRQEQRG